MKILLIHNFYGFTSPSGENNVVEGEYKRLVALGHDVIPLFRFSDELRTATAFRRLKCAFDLSGDPCRQASYLRIIQHFKPDLVHLHNPWPLITYDALLAAKNCGVPTCQTMHNYRLLCTNNNWHGRLSLSPPTGIDIKHMLVGHSKIANYFYNRALHRLWDDCYITGLIDKLFCLSAFQKNIFVKAGFADDRVAIRPNSAPDATPSFAHGDYAFYAGRLTKEKGVDRLLFAWKNIPHRLIVAGSGELSEMAGKTENVTYLGPVSWDKVRCLLGGARFSIICSSGHEAFPLIIPESLSVGTPILVPDFGGLPNLIGIHGRSYDPKVRSSISDEALLLWGEAPTLRHSARQFFLDNYTEERTGAILTSTYQELVDCSRNK